MGGRVCPKNSKGRTRLRFEMGPDQVRRLPAAEALRVFIEHTGRDPRTDTALQLFGSVVAGLLDEEVREQRARQAEAEGRAPRQVRGRGQPPRSPEFTDAIGRLVDLLGPTDAALFTLLCGFDGSRAFPTKRWNDSDQAFDAKELLRRVQKRLSDIAAERRRR